MQDTQVGFLGQEDPLEIGMATHSNILAWRIPWTEEPGRLQSMGSQRVGYNQSDLACTHASFDNQKRLQTVPNVPRGEEMGNSLPVENPCFITMQFLLGMGGGLCCVASRILIFRPGIEPAFPPLKEQS